MKGPESEPEREMEGSAMLIARITRLRDFAFKNQDVMVVHEAVYKKAEDLRKKYPDYNDYAAYHILISSSFKGPGLDEVFEKFDFPEEDAVENFFAKV